MSEVRSTVEYREVPGHPGYHVGTDGSVWRLMKYTVRRGGYRRVKLCTGRKKQHIRRSVHHLVLEAFVGPCPPGMEACHHPDPDRSNNRLENLRWDTKKANAADRQQAGGYVAVRGEKHYKAKLTEEAVRAIRAARAAGETLAVIGARHGISGVMVSAIATRKSWAWLL